MNSGLWAEILFVGSVIFTFYAYAGYPLSLVLVGVVRRKEALKASHFPSVSVIVAAYNEEKVIAEKLEKTLQLDYPREKVQILVASDGSYDRTNEIVEGFKDAGVELVALPERRGKESAQKEAIKRATGEIIVFTDVATVLAEGSLKEIVSNFSDPSVGCVSSEDKVIGKDGKIASEGFYVRYEMWLRRLESKVNSLVGLSGSFFAARREVCEDFSEAMQSDFRTVLNCRRLGLRAVCDPEAVGYYSDVSDPKQEFDRKVRTVLRGLFVFFRHLEFLNVFRYGLFSYQYFCHKLLRWLVPVFLVSAFASNLWLAFYSRGYGILFMGQLLFYALAIAGWNLAGASSRVIMRIPGYFLIVNSSILVAWWRYLRGQRLIMWTPTER